MENLLVIGGSSFVGKNFLSFAAHEGIEIRATYFRDLRFPNFVDQFPNVKPIRFDITSSSFAEPVDTCLYLAGNSNHGLSLENPTLDLTLNTLGLINFLQHVKRVNSFVLLSSAAVYHGKIGLVSPRIELDPSHPYALSKMAAENYVRYFTKVGKIDGHLILRLYHSYGPFEASRRMMARLLHAFVVEGEKEFTVNGDGRTIMDVIYVDELVKILFNAVVDETHENERLDVCSGNPMTLLDLAKKTAEALGIDATIHTNPTVRVDPILFWSKPEANLRFLSESERLSFETGIERYAAWIRSNDH